MYKRKGFEKKFGNSFNLDPASEVRCDFFSYLLEMKLTFFLAYRLHPTHGHCCSSWEKTSGMF